MLKVIQNKNLKEKDEKGTVDHCKTFAALLVHDEHPNLQLKFYWPNYGSRLSPLQEPHC